MPSDLSKFGQGIDLALDGLVSPEDRRALIQGAADELLEDARKEINGQRGEAWRPPALRPDWMKVEGERGSTTVRFELVGVPIEVVEGVLALVRESSPVRSGRYRASHRVYADKQDVTEAMPDQAKAGGVQEFTIQPTVEYGRKLERLFAVYEGAAAVAQRRYGNQAGVYFEFRSPILPYVPGGRNRAERRAVRGQPGRIAAMRVERQTRVPCIFIRPLNG